MSFLTPALLLGLLGLSLPIAAHLFGRRRPRRVAFAAVRFVRPRPPARARQRTLHDVPLFAVRLALLGLALLAFAQPYLIHEETIEVLGQPHDAVVLVDVSASMNLQVDGRSLFERAMERVPEIAASMPPSSRVAFATTSPSGPSAGLAETSAAQFVDALRRRYGTDALVDGASMTDALPRAAELLSADADSGQRPRVIYAISDETASGGGALPPMVGADVAVVRMPALEIQDSPEHVGILRVESRPTPELGPRVMEVSAVVRRSGGGDGERQVKLSLEASDGTRARAQVGLPRNEEVVARFSMERPSSGATALSISLDIDDDPLPHDDRRFAWLRSGGALTITVVNGAPSEERQFDEVYFLETALASMDDELPTRVTTMSPDQLADLDPATGLGLLEGTDVLILANVPAPSPRTSNLLAAFVQRGRGLWILAGDRMDPRAYNAQLRPLLPLELRGSQEVGVLPGQTQRRLERLAPPDLGHPIFQASEGSTPISGFPSAETSTIMLVEPDPGGDAEVALALERGAPALVTREVDDGRVALLTTTVDLDWGTLPLDPAFVPLVERTLRWLGARGLARARASSLNAGGALRWAAPDGEPAFVTRPGGDRLPVTHEAGVAEVRDGDVPGQYTWQDPDSGTLDGVAVNVSEQESLTTPATRRAPPDGLPDDLPDDPSAGAPQTERAARVFERKEPIARILALMALLLLAAESVLRVAVRARR